MLYRRLLALEAGGRMSGSGEVKDMDRSIGYSSI